MPHRVPSARARRTGMPALARAAGVFAAACLAAALLLPAAAEASGLTGVVGVNTTKLPMRQSASTSARTIRTLSRGDVVRIVANRGSWCNVATSGGQTGWCETRYLVSAAGSSTFKPSNTAKLDWPSGYISLTSSFSYQRCMQDMSEIAAAYSGRARIETIGKSVLGNPIRAIVLGNPDADINILVQSAIHAREWLSALLALRQAETMLKAAALGGSYKGVSVANMLENVQIWIVPEANPDGVRLVFEGLASVPASPASLRTSIKAMNGGSTSFIRWKANAHGVDLNRNFDGCWKVDRNYPKPGPYNYGGPRPFSEPESVALRDLTVRQNFALTMSYHTSGEMLYWYNHTGRLNDLNRQIANQLKALNGYAVLSTSAQTPDGGYRDWFVEKFARPGFTMEIGSGYTPLAQSRFNEFWQDNRFVLLELLWTAAPKSLTAVAN